MPFNAAVYTTVALEFASYLARLTGSGVTGLFLQGHGKDKAIYGKHIGFFKDGCEARSVRYSFKREAGDPVAAVIAESRYADVIVMDAVTSFDDQAEHTPTAFVRNVLTASECPSIIAPQHFERIDEIVFMYDGSRSSVFAARQFTYLFPQLDDKKVTVVNVDNGQQVPEKDSIAMHNWVKEHYSSTRFETPHGETSATMFNWLVTRKNVFVVAGAYGRSTLSRFFRESTAEMLIKTVTHAFFLAHY